jgi:hypothetical protein
MKSLLNKSLVDNLLSTKYNLKITKEITNFWKKRLILNSMCLKLTEIIFLYIVLMNK